METQKTSKIKFFLTFIMYFLISPIILLLVSGDWFWIQGWVFSIWFLGMCYTILIYLYLYDPALLEERYHMRSEGDKGWNQYFIYILLSIVFILLIVIIPLDAVRFKWTNNFPLYLEALGLLLLLGSAFFIFRSYKDNTFLSPLVRIQSERDQQTVSTGVYGVVRHPFYLGGILMFIGAPCLMGSIYGFIISIILCLMFVIRIINEENMLVEELDGYAEYKKKVKYRLIPYVW